LRTSAMLETGMHNLGKYLLVLAAALAILGFVLSHLLPALARERRILLFIALSLSLAPAAVTGLKAVSNKHCPWDIEEFGGLVPYVRLFEVTPARFTPGRCFPAGHASGGFSWMALYFVGRARARRLLAYAGLAFGFAVGMILGAARMLQGAHFPSHTLWSALVCWIVILLLDALILEHPTHNRE